MGSSSARHSQPVVRVGALYALSGAAQAYGLSARRGVELAVAEINAQGGVLGRPVEVLFEDEGTPERAITTVQRLVHKEGVDFLLGIDSSAVAEAVVPLLPHLRRILMVTHAATPRITMELFNPFVFRCSLAAHQHARAGALLVASLPHRHWTTLGPNYSFGYFSWAYFSRYLKELKPDVEFTRQTFFHPPGWGDLMPWIREVIQLKPDAVWVSSWGGDLVQLIRQGQAAGLFKACAVYMELGGALEVLEALGHEMPAGLRVGTRYWFLWSNGEVNRRFVEAFYSRYGHYPSYNAQNAYVGMHLLASAANAVGTLEPAALIEQLEGMEWEAPMGHIVIRPADHQAIANAVWGETHPDPRYPFHILDPIWVFKGTEITPPPES